MPINLPRFQYLTSLVDSTGRPSPAFHQWWDVFARELENSFNNIEDTVQDIVDLNSDNLLTPAKKPIWILFNSSLTSEQADLDAKATTYGITTEKTNYDNAISALTTHLATLTTPVLWNDLTGNTTIVGTTFRSKFIDVLTTKQLLLNKIHATAKTLADTAQTSANTAQTSANTAQTTADTVKKSDSIADSWTSPGSILSAADVGATATITVAAHTRKYNDSTSVAVNSSTVTGLAFSTVYYVYYDDSNRAGGAVTYQATTNPNTALPGAAVGRHFCGKITTPADGGGGTSGGYNPPSGGGSLVDTEIP